MNPWLQSNIVISLVLAIALIGAIAASYSLPFKRLRRTLLAMIVIVLIVDICIVATRWHRQPTVKGQLVQVLQPTPLPTQSATPTPLLIAKPSPTPALTQRPVPTQTPDTTPPNKPPASQPPRTPKAAPKLPRPVQFAGSSKNCRDSRGKSCLKGDIEGDYVNASKVLDMNIELNLDPCRGCSDTRRATLIKSNRIKNSAQSSVRRPDILWSDRIYSATHKRNKYSCLIGLAKREDIMKLKTNEELSHAVDLSLQTEELTDADVMMNHAPQHVSIDKKNPLGKKKGEINLEEYGLLILVLDYDKQGSEYFLFYDNIFEQE
jgi:outer membrane biosynthesis protein TonB